MENSNAFIVLTSLTEVVHRGGNRALYTIHSSSTLYLGDESSAEGSLVAFVTNL